MLSEVELEREVGTGEGIGEALEEKRKARMIDRIHP